MKVPYRFDATSSHYKTYYSNQAGGTLPVFKGQTIQRGSGLGGVFSKIFKGIAPVLKSVAKTAGKQLINSGASIANDLLEGKSFNDTAKDNLTQGGKKLFNDLTSSIFSSKVGGAKKRSKPRRIQHKASKNKRRRLTKDIFT